ncbi:MAG: hypothetical protein MHPSP_002146, partial [Paramarteilia canceri]
ENLNFETIERKLEDCIKNIPNVAGEAVIDFSSECKKVVVINNKLYFDDYSRNYKYLIG